MNHKLLVIFFLFSIAPFPAQGRVESINKLTPEEQSGLSQVKVELGGRIQLEQYFKKAKKYNAKDNYLVNFFCTKKNSAKEAECKVIEYKILSSKEIDKKD